MPPTRATRPFGITLVINLGIIVGAYLLLVMLIQMGVRLRFDLLVRSAQVVVGLVGVIVAWRFHARGAAYVFYALLAFSVPLAAVRALFGLATAQGRETHLAVLAAAILGVALGAWHRALSHRSISAGNGAASPAAPPPSA